MADEDDSQGADAAEAFEAMRGELALLRRAVEGLAVERGGQDVPDYSETLGRMSHNITTIGQRVDALTKGSALAMTPDHIAGLIVAASSDARRNDQQIIAEACAGLDQATRPLAGIMVTARLTTNRTDGWRELSRAVLSLAWRYGQRLLARSRAPCRSAGYGPKK